MWDVDGGEAVYMGKGVCGNSDFLLDFAVILKLL